MKEGIGAKGGKKDRKLTFLNIFRNKKIKEQQLEEIKEKEKAKEEENNKNIIQNTPVQQHNTTKPEKTINFVETKITTGKKRENKIEEVEKVSITKTNILNTKHQEDITISKEKTPIEKQEPIVPFQDNINYLEKEIIHILDNNLQENNYQLKKLDSDIFTYFYF